MGLCYSAAYSAYFIKNQDLSDLAQVFFGLGFASAAYGIGKSLKKNTDIMVSSEAEKRIKSTNLPSSSDVPQIQTEIAKQKKATQTQV